MANLRKNELLYFEELFNMKTGYVLDFSNDTFRDFIEESIGADINDDKYLALGTSKANKLRTLIKLTDNTTVSKLLKDLLDYWSDLVVINKLNVDEDNRKIYQKCLEIIKKIDNKVNGGSIMNNNPKVFISYSWDDEEHMGWVMKFCATLREHGIDAKLDVFESQNGTIDLNHMMVKNIRDNDYTIIIMTEKYAKKADELSRGVGKETRMLYNYVLENTQKVIPVKRGNSNRCTPFYLEGLEYINFSDDNNISNSFKELLHKILGINKYVVPELGQIPDLQPQKVNSFNIDLEDRSDKFDIDNELIPDFNKIIEPTDFDKNKFIKESYVEIKAKLLQALKLTKDKNYGFNYELDEVTSHKCLIKVYLNGQSKYAVKMWIGSGVAGREQSICLSYGVYVSDNDTSMNEIIGCKIDENNELFLGMTISYNRNEYMTANDVFIDIWNRILDYIK